MAKAIGYLEKNVQKDGGIYNKGLANYTTSLAIMAFKEANTGGKYDKVIEERREVPQEAADGDGRTEGR